MPKKKVSFESDALKQEFAASKTSVGKKYYTYLYIIIALIVVGAAVYFIATYRPNLEVDWESYGRSVANIKNNYKDSDKIILEIDGTSVKKEEFYKLMLLDKYTFKVQQKYYYDIIDNNPDMTPEQKEQIKPHRPSKEQMLDELINTEIGYKEALSIGIKMDYEISLKKIMDNYSSYEEILQTYDESTEIYQNANDSMTQMKLVASGMGLSMEEYLEYLARDTMKVFACAELEVKWHDEFKTSEFDGTVDDFVYNKYMELRSKYSIKNYGL